ncbi:MAG: glycosyltransferase [Rubripirellula sp.]
MDRRILFIAMSESVHTARWIRQLADTGWDLHLFPSGSDQVHQELPKLTYYSVPGSRNRFRNSLIKRGTRRTLLPGTLHRKMRRLRADWFSEAKRLASTIESVKPTLVHSLEIQHSGYLTFDAYQRLQKAGVALPPWMVTNWGSDTYFFARIDEHRKKIKKVLATCDYYDCESNRDQRAARELGFQGHLFPVTPNGGGFDLESFERLRQPGPTSDRRVVLLKGYQFWAGRAMVALRAIELCADALRGYQVRIYSANDDVRLVAQSIADSTGVDIRIIPTCDHESMMREHGKARISMGISASDGVSTSFLEALVMGSYPIQSNTAAADEWIRDGESGSLVDPHQPTQIAQTLRRALSDDDLVDRASLINARVARERLDHLKIAKQAIGMYRTVFDHANLSDQLNTRSSKEGLAA